MLCQSGGKWRQALGAELKNEWQKINMIVVI